MKILVVSDSHGQYELLARLVNEQKDVSLIVFCGDGHSDIEQVKNTFPHKKIISVRGNCDWSGNDPFVTSFDADGRKILVTHGHMHGVKQEYERLRSFARSQGAHIVLFGHTHTPFLDFDGRTLMMNPGSIGYHREYGILNIEPDKTVTAQLFPKNKYNPPILIKPGYWRAE